MFEGVFFLGGIDVVDIVWGVDGLGKFVKDMDLLVEFFLYIFLWEDRDGCFFVKWNKEEFLGNNDFLLEGIFIVILFWFLLMWYVVVFLGLFILCINKRNKMLEENSIKKMEK